MALVVGVDWVLLPIRQLRRQALRSRGFVLLSRRELDLLVEVCRVLAGAQSLEQGLRRCLESVVEALGARGGSIAFLEGQEGHARIVGCSDQATGSQSACRKMEAFGPASVALQVLEQGTGRFHEDTKALAGGFDFLPGLTDCAGCPSAAVQPLKNQDRIIGVMCLGFGRSREFGPEHRDLLEVLASQLAMNVDLSIQRAEVARHREERLRQEEDMVARLKRVDRMKDEFLSALSHELRTPINAIMGFGSILADGVTGELTPQQERYIGRMLGASDHLLGLVNQLLDVAYIQSGKFCIRPASANFSALVRDVESMYESQARSKSVTIRVEVPEGPMQLSCDPGRIRQILSNLLSNALKFTPAGGTIAVRAHRDAKSVRCEVDDTGIGIPPADQARIFDRFVQVDMSSTRPADGLGLGLYITKALVEAHQGRIGVRSTDGAGTTFWFELPAEPA